MQSFDDRRRGRATWTRLVVGFLALTLLLSPYLLQTRATYPARFWGAAVLLVFFAAWAVGLFAWRRWLPPGSN